MLIIQNTSVSTKVLKTLGSKDLRIFPGFNYIDKTREELATYETKVCKALFKECLKLVAVELTAQEKEQAEKAKAKNDKLNEAKKIIYKQTKEIEKKTMDSAEQAKKIAELIAKIESLENKQKNGGRKNES